MIATATCARNRSAKLPERQRDILQRLAIRRQTGGSCAPRLPVCRTTTREVTAAQGLGRVSDPVVADPLTLASVDGDADRVHAGLSEAVADPNRAVAIIGLLTRHLAITMVGRHGEERGPGRCCRRSFWTPVRPRNDHTSIGAVHACSHRATHSRWRVRRGTPLGPPMTLWRRTAPKRCLLTSSAASADARSRTPPPSMPTALMGSASSPPTPVWWWRLGSA